MEDTKTVEIDGITFTIRRITVAEADQAYDAAEGPNGEVDSRLHSRLVMVSSIVDPPTTIDDILQWPLVRYLRLLRAVNELNSVPELGLGEGISPAARTG